MLSTEENMASIPKNKTANIMAIKIINFHENVDSSGVLFSSTSQMVVVLTVVSCSLSLSRFSGPELDWLKGSFSASVTSLAVVVPDASSSFSYESIKLNNNFFKSEIFFTKDQKLLTLSSLEFSRSPPPKDWNHLTRLSLNW